MKNQICGKAKKWYQSNKNCRKMKDDIDIDNTTNRGRYPTSQWTIHSTILNMQMKQSKERIWWAKGGTGYWSLPYLVTKSTLINTKTKKLRKLKRYRALSQFNCFAEKVLFEDPMWDMRSYIEQLSPLNDASLNQIILRLNIKGINSFVQVLTFHYSSECNNSFHCSWKRLKKL